MRVTDFTLLGVVFVVGGLYCWVYHFANGSVGGWRSSLVGSVATNRLGLEVDGRGCRAFALGNTFSLTMISLANDRRANAYLG